MAVTPVEIAAPTAMRRHDSTWTVVWRFVRKKPLGAAGGVLMLVTLVSALLAYAFETHVPDATNAAATLDPPSVEHCVGTAPLGRYIYSRIAHGARVSLIVGIGSTL